MLTETLVAAFLSEFKEKMMIWDFVSLRTIQHALFTKIIKEYPINMRLVNWFMSSTFF
jgi:hypothetical protein